jgi:phosphoglucomutase
MTLLKSLDTDIEKAALEWTQAPFDEQTQAEVREMLENDHDLLTECFYTGLEFGTGGLRGIMGAGTNRVNKYTIGLATQGLAQYIIDHYPGQRTSVAIAYDSRNNSPFFARVSAEVLSANGIHVYLFDELRPTPELSFAVRHLGCQGGIVVTASHNPPEYNGYKVYWEDGGQVISPHDKGIIDQVRATSIFDVNFQANDDLIHMIGDEVDRAYLDQMKDFCLSPEAIEEQKDLKIVFTSLHGTGTTMVPPALANLGFENVNLVAEQDVPDGNFPTVDSPNPEEAQALKMGLDLCKKLDADILLGTDPDADRVGLAAKNSEGEWVLLNGNQAGSILVYYHLKRWSELGKIDGKQFVAKTIVTTDLIERIAEKFDVKIYNTLTGFKFIAECIKSLEGKEQFITGGEESYGYLVGDNVRDKDAVISSVLFCEIAAWAKSQGMTLIDLIEYIYAECGHFMEALVSVKKEGKAGKEEIDGMMTALRSNPPVELAGSKVISLIDCQAQMVTNSLDGSQTFTGLPPSNVLQFLTEDGSRVTARPSGTEPKIKFYFSVNQSLGDLSMGESEADLREKIEQLKAELGVH